MAIDLSAIKAAAEELKQQREQEARPKSESKRTSKAHADTKKSEGGASYVIPKEFKEAIEGFYGTQYKAYACFRECLFPRQSKA